MPRACVSWPETHAAIKQSMLKRQALELCPEPRLVKDTYYSISAAVNARSWSMHRPLIRDFHMFLRN